MKKIGQLFMIGMSLGINVAYAGIQENIQDFYSRAGGAVNVTPGGAYSSQMSGHYTMGGMTARSPVKTAQFFSAQAPGIRGGCGGFDLYSGSFSFIKSAELKKMLKNITTSGANYAFMIGFETVCPMCKKTMDQLNKLAQEINQWGINSCETSAAIMGSILPRTQATQKYVCEGLGTSDGVLTDLAQSRQACGNPNERSAILNRARTGNSEKARAYQDMFTDKGNLAWMILNKESTVVQVNNQSITIKSLFLGANSGYGDELHELIMTLSGSLILDPKDNAIQGMRLLPSHAGDKNIMQALMYGGPTNPAIIYQCDSNSLDGCLNPVRNKSITIPETQAFVGKVKRLLISINAKAQERVNDPLTPEELNLINSAKIPIAKAINVQSAYSFAAEIIKIEDYAELLAADLLEDYITELLDMVKIGAQRVIVDEGTMKEFQTGIREARQRILDIKRKDTKKFNQALDMVQKIQHMEKMLAGEFSADMARSLDWAVGRR